MAKDSVKDVIPLEKTGAAQTLLYLYLHQDKKEINVTELTRHVNASRETILKSIKFLVKTKLLEENVKREFPFEHTVTLTSKGQFYAKALADIQQNLQHLADRE